MRKILMVGVTAMTLTLGGCFTTGGGGSSPSPANVIAQIQQLAVQACGFFPAVETITQLLQVNTGGYDLLAQQICSVITRPASRQGSPTLYGVPIRGNFVVSGRMRV